MKETSLDFISTLMEMRAGKVAIAISGKLNRVMRAVMETGKPGKLTLVLTVTPKEADLKRGVSRVEVRHKCSTTEPEIEIGPALFYTTDEGGLSRKDPDQMEMEYEEARNG